MDSLIGDTKIVVDDNKPPAENVIYTSVKSGLNVCIGKCFMAGLSDNLKLTPLSVEGWVGNNTFTCPISGSWMIWVNWGHIGPYTGNSIAVLNYKLNNNANVVMANINSNAILVSVFVSIVKGDKIVFPVTTTVTTNFPGTYCFEFIR